MPSPWDALLKPYRFDPELGLSRREDGWSIPYSDGNRQEEYLLEVLGTSTDLSVLSSQLQERQIDWPSRYHLTSQRSLLLRPFFAQDAARPQKIVELGSGFGAITRFLGEEGHSVLAIEGSLRRAQGGALRCRDLEDVSVLCEDIFQLPALGLEADVVTSIGVLEYAPRMVEEQPFETFVDTMVRLGREDALMVVAIENPLGLKYFTGCSEDHSGKLFDSVLGYPFSDGAQALSRVRLEALFEAHGLECRFFFPFPDYKLPQVLYRDEAPLAEYPSLAAWGCRQAFEDYQHARLALASDARLLRRLAEEGQALDLAPSLLCFASRDPQRLRDLEAFPLALGFSPSGERCTYVKSFGDELRVVKAESARAPWLSDELPEGSSVLSRGERLDLFLLEVFANSPEDIPGLFQALSQFLLREYPDKDVPERISPELADFLFHNAVLDGDRLEIFDLEFQSPKPLRVSTLLSRALFHFLRDRRIELAGWASSEGYPTLEAAHQDLARTLELESLARVLELEQVVQSQARAVGSAELARQWEYELSLPFGAGIPRKRAGPKAWQGYREGRARLRLRESEALLTSPVVRGVARVDRWLRSLRSVLLPS